jgi:hypothetical protein
MANVPGAVVGLIGGQVAGRVLGTLLSSRAGERLLHSVDHSTLTPLEHRVLASRWSGNIGKAISGAAALLFLARSNEPGRGGADHLSVARPGTGMNLMGGPTERKIDWVQVMQRVAEVMLAVGAVFKVFGEYLEDRQKTAMATERAAAKRLA